MGSHRKLGFTTDHRVAMLRNMTADLINHGRIVTTVTRAKELRRTTEKMITLGKRGDLHARRQALAFIYDKNAVYKLFEEVAPGYKDRNGGYTRILKLGPRKGDAAEMAIIELV
jgi:large subunit ribosomal protein L17